MIEYRIEATDCRGNITVKPWVECDKETARRAAREAIRGMGFFHLPNITVRKRETIETVEWSCDRPEFINDHLPKEQR